MNFRLPMLALICLALTACEPAADKKPRRSHAETLQGFVERSKNSLNAGDGYADFRKAALAMGWVPRKSSRCLHGDFQAGEKRPGEYKPPLNPYCADMPELGAFDEHGRHLAQFHYPRSPWRMEAVVAGDSERRHVPGDSSGFFVANWSLRDAAAD
ncbi:MULTISPECIES: hypothetical protein [unclassified Lysobacter]|uniref:hypothetical protein n=1 Tax=unclassified Lysobacter TaxID=2635362 RepID=UPI001BEA2FC8|nr:MULTISPECIES: hypothetical protein [unclassified Lysobacter]MBT2745554.1 hypothetical protein [Lysobacter sp. ISL-42]MBT2753493.1 hypothetical protein [Lysobacter sp. ISL-50]MBT2777123.1 hypothetical protein [Lysobacter sp. ISL-54]MBT2780251.1 hypothetical protein [Lysobacter sp. ISL-52]